MSHLNLIWKKLININVSAEGQSLFEQYWATVGNPCNERARFFKYQPGSEPNIDPQYENKIVGYRTGMR